MIGARTRRDGFTLAELLLAISLAAVILVEAGAMFRMASRAYRRSQDEGTTASAAQDALWLIGRDVQGITCPTDDGRGPIMVAASVGGEDNPLLRLRTTGAAASGGRGHVVDYFVFTDESARRLLIRRSEPIGDNPAAANVGRVAWEIVAQDVTDFGLRLFDGEDWTDRWDPAAAGAMPTLIEATLTVRTADGREVTGVRSLSVPVGSPLSPAGGGGGPL